MLYSLVIGLVLGLLLGGRISRLADIRFVWLPLAVAALMVQFIVFTQTVNTALGSLAPPLYVASTAVVLVVVIRNLRAAPGLAIVALGTISNLTAIIANGGYMPVTAEALGVAEPVATRYGGNSVLTADPLLTPLVDRFALPGWLPFWNVFSVGDVLIGIGIVMVMVVAMRKHDPESPAEDTAPPAAAIAGHTASSGGVSQP